MIYFRYMNWVYFFILFLVLWCRRCRALTAETLEIDDNLCERVMDTNISLLAFRMFCVKIDFGSLAGVETPQRISGWTKSSTLILLFHRIQNPLTSLSTHFTFNDRQQVY